MVRNNKIAGIRLEDSPSVTIQRSRISDNPVGVTMSDSTQAFFDRDLISRNGEGVSCYGGSVTMLNSVFTGNFEDLMKIKASMGEPFFEKVFELKEIYKGTPEFHDEVLHGSDDGAREMVKQGLVKARGSSVKRG